MRPVQRRDSRHATPLSSNRSDPVTESSVRAALYLGILPAAPAGRWRGLVAIRGLCQDDAALRAGPGRRGRARGREVAPITKGKVRQNGHSARRARASPGEGPSARGPTSDNAGYRKLSGDEDEWAGGCPTTPRPAMPHGLATLALGTDLSNPFQLGLYTRVTISCCTPSQAVLQRSHN